MPPFFQVSIIYERKLQGWEILNGVIGVEAVMELVKEGIEESEMSGLEWHRHFHVHRYREA